MKLSKLFTMGFVIAGTLGFVACGNGNGKPAVSYTIDYTTAKAEFTEDIKITPKNINEADNILYSKEDGVITFNTATATDTTKDMEVTLEGYFKGKIVNKVKGLVINLKGAYLENENDSVFECSKKTEISAKKGTQNYVVSKGTNEDKLGAITSSKNMEFGGAGTCYVVGEICHGIKCDEAEFKGSGNYYIQGTKAGSAVNCKNFVIKAADPAEPEKIVSMYLYNAKNGIKADETIDIGNGKLYFYGNKTALKTDTVNDDGVALTDTKITLANCTITTKDVEKLQETVTYDKADSVTIIEE